MADVAVRATGLRVVRGGRVVLDGLDFQIGHGSVTGVLGPSGCGKSTLMRAIVGSQSRVSGELEVLGLSAGHPALRSRVGYAAQAFAVYRDLTVRQNLDYFASILGFRSRSARRELVASAIEDVRLGEHAGVLVGRLSGGQLSRVSLAVALLGRPELVVLDEPTVGLDPVLRLELWALFNRLAAERGTAFLVSSHVMDEAERCADLLLMRAGRIIAGGGPQALKESAGTATVEEAFLRLVGDSGLRQEAV
ncbi:ABC transporter ATP-binding protein [Kitasatospora sp. LaBMicrA B282]|uniref:ABC transporter ATP-binding protein n=1 Tax=Kitasatospora sp. LaBMicrA B282 TaxID=3420949 RepID=UPI003D0A8789